MLLADALKKSVLESAIKGKLTKQCAEDGDARDLYASIQAEKKKLIAAGKIKKEKPLPPIEESEIPFPIPKNWMWVRLGEIISFKIGKTPSRHNPNLWGEKYRWVSISDMIPNGKIKETKEGISEIAFKNNFSNIISPKGTLLMSFKLTVGRVSILDIDAVHNEAIISIFPMSDKNDAQKMYFYQILPFLAKNGDSKKAIMGETLNSTSLKNILIPLPPLAEQKRIVDKINEIFALTDQIN